MLIYQIFCGRQAGANLTEHKGKVFKRMLEYPWSKLRRGGFNTVYLLGIWDYRGPIIVNEEGGQQLEQTGNRVPSVFAVTNHRLPHPDLGTIEELKALIESIHRVNLKVITDYVPNQTGTGHEWIKIHPEFYRDNQGSKVTGFSQDVYFLNYDSPALRQEMMEILKNIAGLNFDGVRCDMAHLTPVTFWQETIRQVKIDKPEFSFIAEAYSSSVFDWQPLIQLIEAGFDAVYHEFLYRNLKSVVNHQLPLKAFTDHLNYVIGIPFKTKLVHYLMNHDDPMIPEVINRQPGLMAIALLLPGSVLVYNGQLNGKTGRLAHHTLELLPEALSELKLIPRWFKNIAITRNTLNPQVKQIFCEGENLIKIELEINRHKGIGVVNFADREQSINLTKEYSESGLWQKLKPDASLPSGTAELFLAI